MPTLDFNVDPQVFFKSNYVGRKSEKYLPVLEEFFISEKKFAEVVITDEDTTGFRPGTTREKICQSIVTSLNKLAKKNKLPITAKSRKERVFLCSNEWLKSIGMLKEEA